MSDQKQSIDYSRNAVRLLTRHVFASQLLKWSKSPFPLPIQFFSVEDENTLRKSGVDVDGVIVVNLTSFLWLKVSFNKPLIVVFEHLIHNKRVERVLNLRLCRNNKSHAIRLSRNLFFNIFHDTQHHNTYVMEIRPTTEMPSNCNEIWLSLLRTPVDVNSNEGLDMDVVDYFQTPRLLYNNDIIGVKTFGLKTETIVYYKISVGSSPSVANSTTKIFQNSTQTARFPHRRVDPNSIFVPRNLIDVVERICQVLEPVVADVENESSPIVFVLAGNLGSGRKLTVDLIADRLAVNRLDFDCNELWNVDGRSTDSVVSRWMERIRNHQPCVCEVQNLNVLNGNPSVDLDSGIRILDVLANSIVTLRGRVGLFFTTIKSNLPNIPRSIAKLVHFEERCNDIVETDRRDFAQFVCNNFPTNVSKDWLSDVTRGTTLAELRQLLYEARVNAKTADRNEIHTVDFEAPLETRRTAFGEALGVPKVPTVTWKDVGGLEKVKELINESLRANLDPKRSANTRRSGVILYGPPGCGKTLIAKAVANEFQMTFLSVKGPELLNQYVGQSEQNLRNVFEKARLAAPSIIFFDELDSLAPSRGIAGDSGGVMDRLVSQLLAELDDLQTTPQTAVFVMGATNRKDLIDDCLLTPGRFDRVVEVEMATDRQSKIHILRPICKNVNLEDSLDIEQIADLCPSEMSGAELSALISNAAMVAIREVLSKPDIDPKAKVQIRLEHIKQTLFV
ncbi:AAA domain-containing protein [Aphelenchoides besseyi]|nr:AAA domain-containing protein [Aphelenchoides besseyi]